MMSCKEFMIESSSHYLVEPLTEGYDEWLDDYLYEYIDKQRFTTFEDYDAEQVYLMIENTADGFWRMYNKSVNVMTEEDKEGVTFAIDVLGDFCDSAPDEVTREYEDAIYKLNKLILRAEK